MVCMYCFQPLNVINSRRQRRNNQVWRRRQCSKCGAIFTTHEAIDLAKSLIVKDARGKFTPFTKGKLFLSIYKSCQHRQTALNDALALTDTIIGQCNANITNGLIHRHHIAVACQSVLQRFDKAAVVQYEAYHTTALAAAY